MRLKIKKGVENSVADHLSRLTSGNESDGHVPLDDSFPDERLFAVSEAPWYADIVNFLATGMTPLHWSPQDLRRFYVEVHFFYFSDLFLYKYCGDHVIRKYVPNDEYESVLNICHENACGGHFSTRKTVAKILQSGFYWPSVFRDAHLHCKACSNCQQLGGITGKNQMPSNPILHLEIFDYWGIDFMGPFPISHGHMCWTISLLMCRTSTQF